MSRSKAQRSAENELGTQKSPEILQFSPLALATGFSRPSRAHPTLFTASQSTILDSSVRHDAIWLSVRLSVRSDMNAAYALTARLVELEYCCWKRSNAPKASLGPARDPQSAQSVPRAQRLKSCPGPPSSQKSSRNPAAHVFSQMQPLVALALSVMLSIVVSRPSGSTNVLSEATACAATLMRSVRGVIEGASSTCSRTSTC